MNSTIHTSAESGVKLAPESIHHLAFRTLHYRHRLLRMCCWVVVLALGAASAWAARFTMYPDGISYLDIGDAFWRGDWHNAINAYWSPLYPWIVGFFLKLLKPAPQWEYPVVHLVNFLIYIVALISFDFFLNTFLKQEMVSAPQAASQPETGLPTWAWFIVGYSAFIISSLFLITISFVSGDMLVAAIIYFATALILKIRQGRTSWRIFALLGLALGIGYFAKTAMFLMAFPFLAVAVATQKGRAQKIRGAAISLCFFLMVSAPLVFLLSKAKGRPTFGDSGKVNYLMNVGTTQFFIPDESVARHPVRKISALPEAYEYSSPIAGTYPLWYDPSYWHEGIAPHFNLWRQIRALLLDALSCAWIFFNVGMGLSITVAICFLYLVGVSIRDGVAGAVHHWVLWVPALAGIALYSLVVIEPRYVAGLFCLLWMVGFAGVRLPTSAASRRLMGGAVLALAVLTFVTAVWQISQALDGAVFAKKDIATPICSKIAESLIVHGIKPGDRIAIMSDWLFPSRQGAYIARLARARIVAEARPQQYWAADATTRSQLLAEFAKAGAKVVLTHDPPQIETGWQRQDKTGYYLYFIDEGAKASASPQHKTP